ncbi:phage major capsid protein [Streptomyces sp. NPDC058762]|uniref:phage major capsid protein n=1 Tax=Streptomyces sp. NPDC058762 TaxID=3346629 RepID=UPI0036ADCAAD
MATPTIPRNADELAEMLADNDKVSEIAASRDSLKDFITAYGEQQQGDGTDLNRLIDEGVQKGLADFFRNGGADVKDKQAGDAIKRLDLNPQNNRGSRANMLTSHRQGTAHNPGAAGAQLDEHFASGIDYVQNIWHKNPNANAEKLSVLRNAASSVSPADGGFLVPETLRSQLLEIALEMSVVRPLATVVPMESARVPFPMIDSTTNQGSVFGGMVAYWGEEGAELTDSSPKFGRITLDAKKLTGLSAVPNELLQDSISSFAALLERLWPQALAFSEDNTFMAGSGVGEPLGFRGAGNTAAVVVPRTTANKIKYADIVKMYSRMLPSSLSRAVWTCSPDALPELLQMALDVGTGGNSVFVVNAAAAHPMTIFGRPLIITEKASTLGARGDLAFSDLSYYLVGDRQTMTADSSTDYKFGSDKTTFRIIQRVDGQPWLKSAITPANGSSNTLSPFVELKAETS